KARLKQIQAYSVGDAAKYFSGALIKDYGGTGGLKTISVRSLGAAHTAIVYDGVPVSDLQSGQIDLSRFSNSFIQSLQLYQSGSDDLLIPARAAAAGALLSIKTVAFDTYHAGSTKWQAAIKAGSFNHLQPSAALYLPVSKNVAISGSAEALYSKGNYPVNINNGNLSEKTRRNNSEIRSLQSEVNLSALLPDSSNLQVKLGTYFSDRGLPGPIVFFNERSVQDLYNGDAYLQSRWNKSVGSKSRLVVSGKYQRNLTRYRDPDFPNNAGGLNNRYLQEEGFLSAAASRDLSSKFSIGAASDLAYTTLSANTANYTAPARWTSWNHVTGKFKSGALQANSSLTYQHVTDITRATGVASPARNVVTPSVAVSVKPGVSGPWLIRAFYKKVFRVPTFNDLYYTLVGNSSLKPEFADHYNVGATYSTAGDRMLRTFSAGLDAYHLTVKDKIVAAPSRNLFVWTMLNLGKVHVTGVDLNTELSGLANSLAWYLRIAYTWQRAIDVTDVNSPSYKNRIPYTPDHSGSGMFSLGFSNWKTGYNGIFSGHRFTLGENNDFNKLPAWMTHDFFITRNIQYSIFEVELRASVINAGDARYDIVRYYPMPGRSFQLSILFNHL
ncbi:MAG: TonB-dependent receptor, partial [Chitinophagaceae bacterium]